MPHSYVSGSISFTFVPSYICMYVCPVYFSSSHTWQGALDTILGDTSWLVNCSRFKAFSGYSTNKTQHHDIIEIQNVLYKWY